MMTIQNDNTRPSDRPETAGGYPIQFVRLTPSWRRRLARAAREGAELAGVSPDEWRRARAAAPIPAVADMLMGIDPRPLET